MLSVFTTPNDAGYLVEEVGIMIRNIIWMLTGFALGMLSLFMYGKMADEKAGRCASLLDELYVNKPHEGRLTEWIYEARSQDHTDVEFIALKVRELAYVFSAAYAGLVSSGQNEYIQKLNEIKHVLGVVR